jgi:hypothetical protein
VTGQFHPWNRIAASRSAPGFADLKNNAGPLR